MKSEDELKDELRGQMGLHYKNKFDALLGTIEKRHQSQLQALKEVDLKKVAEQEALGVTAEDNFIHGAEYILNLITNLEEQ